MFSVLYNSDMYVLIVLYSFKVFTWKKKQKQKKNKKVLI